MQVNTDKDSLVPNSPVEESGEYENYMDVEKRKDDNYNLSLDKFFDTPVESKLVDLTKAKKSTRNDIWKSIYVHFRTLEDVADFCAKINQMIPGNTKSVFFPLQDSSATLFKDDEDTPVKIVSDLLVPKQTASSKDISAESRLEMKEWKKHWIGMPEFTQEEKKAYRTITINFRSENDYSKFSDKINQELSEKTKSIWHPELNVTANRLLRWVEDGERTLPKYPMYIVSKGRHESMYTSRSLARMQIPHSIVVEPQDYQKYDEALDNFDIRDYVTLLVAPFSNHGDGPGRARNWAWDHSISIGATSHWVFDDNISDFYRLHQNQRIRFESGAGFKAMEDFVDRYDNVYISGPQYRFFVAPDQKYPPYVANTRIYSSLLIRNDCPHRWRGRYNEDTDICLRVLKDGFCTVQFNSFLQGKAATQTVKGGNTEEFYHAENSEKIDDRGWNADGTINKSQMLVDMHPDVTRLVWRYGRWHHWVDYSPFKRNKLQYKPDTQINPEPNNYGMRLETNFNG